MERLEFDLLFRWFVGLGVDEPVWDHSSFSKNRDRLLDGDIAAKFLAAVLAQPRVKRLLSSEHFSVDGTLIEAWASMKSFKPRQAPGGDDDGDDRRDGGRNAPADFKGEKRSNATHASTTDPDALLYRKGPGMEAKLCFIGHGLMENRCGLIVGTRVTRVSGHAERLAALSPWPDFGERFARAMRIGWESMSHQLLDESARAEVMDMAGVSARKLYVDTVKWLLARRVPETFGDRLAISGNTGAGATVNVYLPAKGAPGDGARITIDGQAVDVEE
jgi:hypothetical protein